MNGFVKNLVVDRNYGFIRVNNSGDYFFHRDDCECVWEDLVSKHNLGRVEVEFDSVVSPKGPRAANVRLV